MALAKSECAVGSPRPMIHGVLLLDKPAGLTSNAALQRVRRLFGRIKAGHTGTLDPLATGLLPICLGEATKFSHSLLDADKTYEAVIRLRLSVRPEMPRARYRKPVYRISTTRNCRRSCALSPGRFSRCRQCTAR